MPRFAPPLVLGALLLGGACDRGSPAPVQPETGAKEQEAAPALSGWRYDVTLASSLHRAEVRMCFAGSPPARVIPGDEIGLDYATLRGPEGEPLEREGGGYATAHLPPDACIDYQIDFGGLVEARGVGRMAGETGQSLMARPSTWLWRPDSIPSDAEITLQMKVPEGMDFSLAWPTRGDAPRGTAGATYLLDATAFRWLSYAVFGEVTIDRFERAGAQIEIVTLDAPVACPPEGLRAWISDAVDSVAMLFEGRFPRERLQVVVIPVDGGGSSSVYFGMAGRGGGAGVYVYLDDTVAAERLPGGWTTVHELLHHGMPFIDEPWMGEGFVSYYTELMRTRMGHRSELEGWQALRDAFERGRRYPMSISLAETSDRMHETHAYQRVYWGGAAVAFLADVQMRLETDGQRSLDDAIRELRRCCGDTPKLWKAQDLLEHLDRWYGRPLFTETARAVLSESRLPDVEAAMARLGVVVEGDTVRLDDEHPAAAIRRSLMAPPP